MTVPVEVNIQDCFWQASEQPSQELTSLGKATSPDCPIDITTWQSWFQIWLDELQEYLPEANSYELNLRLTNDTEIQSLNTEYRSQDKPTDVLAFATLEVNCPVPPELLVSQSLYLGDIVISVETANQQAQEQHHSLKTELGWLATHGLLHLIGWDHPDDESLAEMLNEQRLLLRAIQLVV